MEQITDDVIGKVVVGPGGEELGKVKAINDGMAIVEAETNSGRQILESITDGEQLALAPNDMMNVTDKRIYVADEETATGTAPGEDEGRN